MENKMADQILNQVDKKQTPIIVGLDPFWDVKHNRYLNPESKAKVMIPYHLIKDDGPEGIAEAFLEFNKRIIDATHDIVAGFKPQMAFYEKLGPAGVEAFMKTVEYIASKKSGLIATEDAKRNDIGNTANAYAAGHLGTISVKNKDQFIDQPMFNMDMLTINPYMGTDTIEPFFKEAMKSNKGIFVLTKTSNKGSGTFQDKNIRIEKWQKEMIEHAGVELYGNDPEQVKEILMQNEIWETSLYNSVATVVNHFAQQYKGKRGYSSIGAVVGATYPKQAEEIRKIMPNSIFLIPGVGFQAEELGLSPQEAASRATNCFNQDGYGGLVNSSRGIIFAYDKLKDDKGQKLFRPEEFDEAARYAAIKSVNEFNHALQQQGKMPKTWSNWKPLEQIVKYR